MSRNQGRILLGNLEDSILKEETKEFLDNFKNSESTKVKTLGVELEAWIIDKQQKPAPVNKDIINLLGKEEVVEEIS